MKPKYSVSMLLLVTLVASSLLVRVAFASDPVISVSPDSKTVNVGEQFTIDINLDYAQNLYGYEVWLSFDNSKLNATAIDYMDYLNPPKNIWHQEVNNIGGYVALAVSSLRPASPKTGGSPPPLATVSFKAIDTGSSTLHLYNTILSDNRSLPIPCTTIDGTVYVVGEIHDVAVIDVKPWKTVVGQGYNLYLNVTVTNEGSFTETFNTSAYADRTLPIGDEIIVGKKEVSNLLPGENQVLIFLWNTTGIAKGNYTISALADPVLGETNTADNNRTDGWILITKVGDLGGGMPPQFFKCDGVVDGKDKALFLLCYKGTAPPEAMYLGDLGGGLPPQFFKCDGVVDGKDKALFLLCYKGLGPPDL